MENDTLTFYKSKLGGQWRWRYQAAGNSEKLANGGESYRSLDDAINSAFRVCGIFDFNLDNLANENSLSVMRADNVTVHVRVL
jgi:uncharacterized protein YegP (UPF0339 family)